MTPSIVAFIFARGGSKGLPRKNLRLLAGKPLIVHAVETGLALPRVSKVIISTDDAEIAAVAERAGGLVPFMRPAELASDSAPEWLAWQHAVRETRALGYPVDIFVSLPPTSPLRMPGDVDCAIDLKLNSDADIVITVREAERNPYFNMVRAGRDGSLSLAIEGQYHRRQDAPPIYDITTVAYVANADFILSASRIFDGKVRAIEVPRERAIDIDTEYDLRIAEATAGLPAGMPARFVGCLND